MTIKNKIFSYLPELSDNEVIDAHKDVVNSINKLNELIPSEYRDYNLIDIIMPKAYGYHTGFDTLYKKYCRIIKFLNKILFNKMLAAKISYQIVKKSYPEIYNENKDEMLVQFSNKNKLSINKSNYNNVFFANAQSYLRVIVMYINKSSNNNLLIVPKYLSDVEILNKIDKNILFFYEDFMNREITLAYEKAKILFKDIYINNQNKLEDYFTLSLNSFSPIIKVGLKNIFYYLLPQAVLFYLTNQEIFKNIQVKNVIGVRVRKIYDRAFYECAKNNSVNRYVLFHGNIGIDVNYIHSMGNFHDLTGVFTWGEQQKQIIENDIFSKVKVFHITGSPLFENEYSKKKISKNGKKIILYAATNNDFFEISELAKIVHNYKKKLKLVIKVHPGESSIPYEKFINNENISLVTGDKVLEDILPTSDLLITTISESALQGMLFKVPTMMLILNKKWEYLLETLYSFNKDEKNLMVIYQLNEIEKKINNILKDKIYCSNYLEQQDKILAKRILIHKEKHGSVRAIDKILQ